MPERAQSTERRDIMAKDPDHAKDEAISTMRSPVLRRREADLTAFRAYWDGLRRGADVPCRADVDPRGIEALLGEAFVIERIAPGLARLRIAGTHLSDMLGMEVRGMPLSALFQSAHRDPLADDLVQLFDAPAIVHHRLRAHPARGAALDATMVMLPLRSDLGDTSRALGCVLSRGTLGKAPHRFEILGRSITLLDLSGHPAAVSAQAEAQSQTSGFAEPHTPFGDSGAEHPSERPYLRLVR